MLKEPTPAQQQLEMVTLEMLVPQDHLLRKIDATVDFSFIRDHVAHLYCADNGRPALDPVVMFKLLFIGYLYGVRSERQLMREVQVNVAYRWFAGFSLTDKVPDASTFSQNRRRRFREISVYQGIFDEIVRQAIAHKLVGGRVLYTDSTHLKASANKKRFEIQQVERTPAAYLAELDAAVDADRTSKGKQPLKRDADKGGSPPTVETKVSRTDPDSGYMTREGKPQGFFYLDHRTVDGKHAIITDTYVTAGNVHDSQPYLERLDRQIHTFSLNVEAVGLDAGYFTPMVCQGLAQRAVLGVMGYRRSPHKAGMFYKREYRYAAASDSYTCPQGQQLAYSTTNRQGYREYKSNSQQCRQCPVRHQCTRNANAVKVVTRHVWEAAKEAVNARRLTDWGKRIYARRKETVERSFADAKQLHGHRYARMRGWLRVSEQCLLAAAAQNIKKIALLRTRAKAKAKAKAFLYWLSGYSARILHRTPSTRPSCIACF